MHRGARQLPVQHLSVRLPWHDTGWSGTVCREPAKNSWCMVLKGIRDRRDEAKETSRAGSSWLEEDGDERPACVVERGAALNPTPYAIRSRHPFAESSKATHGHFAENTLHVPAFSVLAVPYRWTRKDDAEAIATGLDLPFDSDREPDLGFETPWLNDFDNQGVMLDTFFGAVQADVSLVFLYVKRTPLADDPRRVLVGVGTVRSVGPLQEHAYVARPRDKLRGLIWDRAVTHSIRPGAREGFVLPYQELLAVADEKGLDPSQFLAFAPDEAFEAFSNVAEHVSHDHAIASLLALADRVRVVREHVAGPWDVHLDWISGQLARLWQLRGPFPGLGPALHAFELGYGTMLAMDLASQFAPDGKWTEDPWELVARALATPNDVLSAGIAEHVQPFDAKRLGALTGERRRLLELLSRFQLTVDQAKRFFDRLGAKLGVTMVLHTWTRELLFHPHVHCIVTAGGLTEDGGWGIAICNDVQYVEPARVLAERGAAILFVPTYGAHRPEKYAALRARGNNLLVARAVENRMTVVAADVAGREDLDGRISEGVTAVLDSDGAVLARAQPFEEERVGRRPQPGSCRCLPAVAAAVIKGAERLSALALQEGPGDDHVAGRIAHRRPADRAPRSTHQRRPPAG